MLQHTRVFSTDESFHPDITRMAGFNGWYDPANPQTIPTMSAGSAQMACDLIQALPPGRRIVFLKGILRYEAYLNFGADPMFIYENGGLKLSRNIMYLRAFGRELRRRGLYVDAIWTDNEGGTTAWDLTPTQINYVLTSPKARARMTPAVRALTPDMFVWGNANFHSAMITFNAWARNLMYNSLRQVLVGSGIFKIPQTPGGAAVQPITINTNVAGPTWTVYDPNGWPIDSYLFDGKSSSPACTLQNGSRYANRVHAPLWNSFLDWLNVVRSCMARPGAGVWPIMTWPSYTNTWLFEQMLAHMARTGVNWTTNKCAFIYWREGWTNAAVEDPIFAAIAARHDQPFAPLRNLPEIPMDADFVTTAGFTTTYTDFLANVPPTP